MMGAMVRGKGWRPFAWGVAGLVMAGGVVGIYLVERVLVRQANEAVGAPPDFAAPLSGGLTDVDILGTLAPMAVWVLVVALVVRRVTH
jgi:hypothetical protein